MFRKLVQYNRANGGVIDLGPPVPGVTAAKIGTVIYSGKDFKQEGILTIYIKGFDLGYDANLGTPYTGFFFVEGEGSGDVEMDNDYIELTHDGNPVPPIKELTISCLLNGKPVRDGKVTIEVIFESMENKKYIATPQCTK